MPRHIPKDLDLARCAFIEYHGHHIPFEALNPDYQMRWVRVARAVAQGQRAYSRKPNGEVKTYKTKSGRKWSHAQRAKFTATRRAQKEARDGK